MITTWVENLWWQIPAFLMVVVVGAVGLIIYSIENITYATSSYNYGQMVKMKAFDQTGMLVRIDCYKEATGRGCIYSIRFSALQLKTNTSLFNSDGPVSFSPVALVHGIREFEIEPL